MKRGLKLCHFLFLYWSQQKTGLHLLLLINFTNIMIIDYNYLKVL